MYLFDSQSVRIGDITTSFPLHLVIPDITGLLNSIGLGNIIALLEYTHLFMGPTLFSMAPGGAEATERLLSSNSQ